MQQIKEEGYKLKLENFEGPFDLLYHLVEKNKMNISEIKISEITDQYIEYINSMERLNLEITGDFLVMASDLLYIKSKSLLPIVKEEETENLEEELISRLLEYKQVKEVALEMKQNSEEFSKIYYKGPENINLKKEAKVITTIYPSDLLPSVFMKLAQLNMDKINHNADDIEELLKKDKVTVRSKIKEILKCLLKEKKIIFNKIFTVGKQSKHEIVTAFLAMLELNRANRIRIKQEYIFSDINIEKE